MRHIILIGLFALSPVIAGHHMQSDEARNMEADYKERISNRHIADWSKHWSGIRSDAHRIEAESSEQKKESYERIARCANFLAGKPDYFDHRDSVNEITQGIDDATVAAVNEKGIDHPLCQKIETLCNGDVNGAHVNRLIHSAHIVLSMENLPPVWWWWGYDWLPKKPDYYIMPDEDTAPEPEIAQKAQALLACYKCLEQDQTPRKRKEEFVRRFINRGK